VSKRSQRISQALRLANGVHSKNVLVLTLLVAANAAAASTNVLGGDYSEWFPAATQMATDTSGSLYLLANCPGSGAATSCVTKLSADGKTMLWQDALGLQASTMAVSPAGDVFVIPVIQPADTSLYVAKLGAAGSGIAWKAAAGFLPPATAGAVLAADSQGRTYVSAPSADTSSYDTSALVVRLNAAGNAVDWTTAVTGWPSSIAADGTGAVVVAGYIPAMPILYVTRVAPNGSAGYYVQLPEAARPELVLDATGNAVIFAGGSGSAGLLQRLNSTGSVIASTSVIGSGPGNGSPLALDAAGNAYVPGTIGQLYPVANSIAPCLPSASSTLEGGAGPTVTGTAPLLTAVAPDGSISQITYLPGAAVSPLNSAPLIATGANSTVFVATTAAAGFVPTQVGPFPQAADQTFLTRLSAQSAAQTLPLACVGNAATYFTTPVAPGEMVTLIGNGLGPAQGVQAQLTRQSPYPTQVSGVEVTFNGTPASLMWVQGSQINAIAPWSLTPGDNTEICVLLSGATTNCLTWPVAPTAPAVFTVDGSHAVALNQDGTINSANNPAPVGSIVAVWATGLGPIHPPQPDGAEVVPPLPDNLLQAGVEAWWFTLHPPFGASLSPAPVPVTYAGPAPYLVSGTSQVNFQIPANPSGIIVISPTPTFYLTVPSTSSTVPAVKSQNFSIYVAGQ
jgi:uncharacterized protein (TIGR03437 family)